jgi:hypothetical protein
MAEPRCETCRHFGRTVFADREPSGQCQAQLPGKFEVTHRTELTICYEGKRWVSFKVIESPFPGVWPWDKCGQYQEQPNDPRPADPDPARPDATGDAVHG